MAVDDRTFTEARAEARQRFWKRSPAHVRNPYANTVVGIGRGPKETQGKLGDHRQSDCLRFYVSAKPQGGVLDPANRDHFIPAKLDCGVPTDVVEVGRVRSFNSSVSPGAVITLSENSAVAPGDFGALGGLVREKKTNALGLLTCNHVIAWNGRVPPGSHIHIASRNQFISGTALALANLANWLPLRPDEDNLADCAYATIAPEFETDPGCAQRFDKLNPVGEVGRAALGDKVVRIGGEVVGIVSDVSATIEVDYEFGTYRLTNQIVIRTDPNTPRFATEGDSGSIVFHDNGDSRVPVAMVWGGRRNLTYASPLQTCLDTLDLNWVAPN